MTKHFESLKGDDYTKHLVKTSHEFRDWHERRNMSPTIESWDSVFAHPWLSRFTKKLHVDPYLAVWSMIDVNARWAVQALASWKHTIPDFEKEGLPLDLIYLIVEFCGDLSRMTKAMRLERKLTSEKSSLFF